MMCDMLFVIVIITTVVDIYDINVKTNLHLSCQLPI